MAREQSAAERDHPGHRRPQRPMRALLASTAGRALTAVAAALLIATVVAMVALWPSKDETEPSQALGGKTVAAEVQSVALTPCGPAGQRCRELTATISEGPGKGDIAVLTLGPQEATQSVDPGATIRVSTDAQAPAGSAKYGFVDIDRRSPLILLVIAFAIIGVVVARRQGFFAVIGLLCSVALITTFLVHAILAGESPVLVSVVAGMAVMFITLGLTYGLSAQSLAAATGIGICLLLATLLGSLALESTQLDGRGGEYAQVLSQANVAGISLQGIVLAGMVIGALGVLTDTAVTQASAVMAVRRSNPALGVRELYHEGFTVGRDHLAATIHTLVMAYVGTLLPLLLVLEAADVGISDALNGQLLAEPLVATIIGSVALMASVPLTTALTAVLAVRVPAEALAGGHEHAH